MKGGWSTKVLIISVIISVVVIAIIISGTYSSDTIKEILSIDPTLILVALGLHLVYWFSWAGRIKVLAKSLNYKITYFQSLNIVILNVLAASVTPSNAGGEPVRIKMLNDLGVRGGDATAIVIGERVSDAIFLLSLFPILLIFFSFMLSGLLGYLLFIAVILLGSLLLIVFIIVWKHKNFEKLIEKLEPLVKIFIRKPEKRFKIMEKLKQEFKYFYQGLHILIMRRKINFVIVILLSAILWISDFIIFSVVLLAFHQNPLWAYSILAQIFIVLLTIIPISPGGSGIVELAAAFLYGPFIPKDIIGVVILIWRFIVFYLNIIIGLIFTIRHVVKNY
ncbi:MAG: flippase-like domain-containing protein [Thermoplasmata archaeon]|nr:flippase-like domain-containing protein [Thermoplasmata archaeon]